LPTVGRACKHRGVRRGMAIIGLLIAAGATLAGEGARGAAAQELPPRASAILRVPSSCPRTRSVRVVVTGREIERIAFRLNGRRVGSLTRPNDGSRWVLTRRTRSLRVGRHRVVARVVFTERSERSAATLDGTIRRCAPR
jgi:hypothetical protein